MHNSFHKLLSISFLLFFFNSLSGVNCSAKERILFLSSQLKATEYFAVHQNTKVLVGLKNHLELKGKLVFINDSVMQVKRVCFKASDINFICVKDYDRTFKVVSGICYLISGVGTITEVWLTKLEESTTDPVKIDNYQKLGGCILFPLCGCGLLGIISASSNKMLNNSRNFDLRVSYKAAVIALKEKSKYINELNKSIQKTGIDD